MSFFSVPLFLKAHLCVCASNYFHFDGRHELPSVDVTPHAQMPGGARPTAAATPAKDNRIQQRSSRRYPDPNRKTPGLLIADDGTGVGDYRSHKPPRLETLQTDGARRARTAAPEPLAREQPAGAPPHRGGRALGNAANRARRALQLQQLGTDRRRNTTDVPHNQRAGTRLPGRAGLAPPACLFFLCASIPKSTALCLCGEIFFSPHGNPPRHECRSPKQSVPVMKSLSLLSSNLSPWLQFHSFLPFPKFSFTFS